MAAEQVEVNQVSDLAGAVSGAAKDWRHMAPGMASFARCGR